MHLKPPIPRMNSPNHNEIITLPRAEIGRAHV